jgi:hypothetical protein
MTIKSTINEAKPGRSDERPGLVFIALLAGALLGTLVFYCLAYRSWDESERYFSDSNSVSKDEIKALHQGVRGYRYQLFGLIIEEHIDWGYDKNYLPRRTPGGFFPWVVAFASFGGIALAVGCFRWMYRRTRS